MTPEMQKKIRALVEKYNVPSRLTPDWEWTNHFELTDEHGRLWLDVEDALVLLPDGLVALSDEKEDGRRLGFCLEAAALVAEMAGVLDAEESARQDKAIDNIRPFFDQKPSHAAAEESARQDEKTLDELAAEQGVKPMDDVRKLFGTWPGENNDGFGEKENETETETWFGTRIIKIRIPGYKLPVAWSAFSIFVMFAGMLTYNPIAVLFSTFALFICTIWLILLQGE